MILKNHLKNNNYSNKTYKIKVIINSIINIKIYESIIIKIYKKKK